MTQRYLLAGQEVLLSTQGRRSYVPIGPTRNLPTAARGADAAG